MIQQNTFGDALSCPYADFCIIQETSISFKCPKCRWMREFELGAAHEFSRLRIPDCFDCEHYSELKQYEIIDGKCKEIENDTKTN